MYVSASDCECEFELAFFAFEMRVARDLIGISSGAVDVCTKKKVQTPLSWGRVTYTLPLHRIHHIAPHARRCSRSMIHNGSVEYTHRPGIRLLLNRCTKENRRKMFSLDFCAMRERKSADERRSDTRAIKCHVIILFGCKRSSGGGYSTCRFRGVVTVLGGSDRANRL